MEQTSHTYTSKNKAQQTSNSMPFVHILHDSDSGQIQKEEIPIFTLTATNNWVNNQQCYAENNSMFKSALLQLVVFSLMFCLWCSHLDIESVNMFAIFSAQTFPLKRTHVLCMDKLKATIWSLKSLPVENLQPI